MRPTRWAAVLWAAAITLPAAAETSAISPAGFVSSFRTELAVTPQAAWQAVVQLPRWWSDEHTWSGKAIHMRLDAVAGGCWCERWGEGLSVMHGQVALAQPGKLLRLYAQLGPLQELPVAGVLTFSIGADAGRTLLRMTYRVSGGVDAGLDRLAPLVDRVLGEQFARLKAFVEAVPETR